MTGVKVAASDNVKLQTFLFALLASSLMLGACFPASQQAMAQFTPTPTPFLPLIEDGDHPVVAIDEVGAEAAAAVVGDFAPPSAASDVEIPAPMGRLPQPNGQVNILLLGSDQRPNEGGFRTDVILLLTINSEEESVSLTSFPRDLYVYIPGWRMDRINAAQVRGGFELTAQTLDYNFGVRPDFYVFINFNGFMNLIDALGGITVNVGRTLTDQREGPGDFTVPAGSVTMDGETALWYVRSRGTSSDFDRTRRQQEVLLALFSRLLSLNALTKAPQLYDQFKQTIETNMGIAEILPFVPLAATVNGNGQIHRYAIGPSDVESYRTQFGAAVLLPKRDVVREIMLQALSSPETQVIAVAEQDLKHGALKTNISKHL